MAADLVHPDDRPDPTARFRADLAGYLRGRPGPELADLLAGLPDPVTVDLLAALAARGPAHAGLPDTWPAHPDDEFMRRRSLREVLADRRAARAARRAEPPPGAMMADWLRTRPQVTPPTNDPVVERRLGEALRARAPQRGEGEDRVAMAGTTRAARASPSRPPRAGAIGGCPTTSADPAWLGAPAYCGRGSRFPVLVRGLGVERKPASLPPAATAADVTAHCSRNFLRGVGFELRPLPGAMRTRRHRGAADRAPVVATPPRGDEDWGRTLARLLKSCLLAAELRR
jgi:hypothetical protein